MIKHFRMLWIIISHKLQMFCTWTEETKNAFNIPFIRLLGWPTTQIKSQCLSKLDPCLRVNVLCVTFDCFTTKWSWLIDFFSDKYFRRLPVMWTLENTRLTWPYCVLAACFRNSKSLPFRCFCKRNNTYSQI